METYSKGLTMPTLPLTEQVNKTFIEHFRHRRGVYSQADVEKIVETYKADLLTMLEGMKKYKNGKPWKNPDYDCDCGYSYDDCTCEYNQAISDVIDKVKGKL